MDEYPTGTGLAIALLLLVVFATCNWKLDNWGKEKKCADTAALMQVPHRWDYWTGCLIKPGGQGNWVPLNTLRTIAE